jgi:uncharacterized protein YktA (UPF0223 family)
MSDITLDDIRKVYYSKPNKAEITLCYSGKKAIVRALKMKDKKEILKTFEKDGGKSLDLCVDNIIEKYSEEEDGTPINAKELVEEEREQIFLAIRRNSTQNDNITINHVCPKCNKMKEVEFPFENIKTTQFVKPESPSDKIISSKGDIEFTLSQLTRGDVLEIDEYIKKNEIKDDVEQQFIRVAATIKSITIFKDDVGQSKIPTLKERIEFIDILELDDFEKIAPYFKACPKFGSTLNFSFTCECGYKSEKEEADLSNFFIN